MASRIVISIFCLGMAISGWTQGAKNATMLAGGGNYGACGYRPDHTVVFTRFDFEKGGEIIFTSDFNGKQQELFPGSEPMVRGNFLVYIGNQEGQEGIWLYDFTAKTKKRLSLNPADHSPVLMPGYKTIIFSSFRDNKLGLFYLEIANGKTVSLRVDDAIQPDVSPDGGQVVFVRNKQIWNVMLKGGAQRRLTNGNDDFAPAFSPNGRQIVYVEQSIQPLANVAVVDWDSGNKRTFTDGATEARSPRFSPDGKKLIYVGLGPRKDGGGGQDGNAVWILPVSAK